MQLMIATTILTMAITGQAYKVENDSRHHLELPLARHLQIAEKRPKPDTEKNNRNCDGKDGTPGSGGNGGNGGNGGSCGSGNGND